MTFAPLSERHKCKKCGKDYIVFAMFSIDQSKCPDCMDEDFLKEYPTIHCNQCNKGFIRQVKDFRKEVSICLAHKSEREVLLN